MVRAVGSDPTAPPLAGRRIVVTRPRDQAGSLAQELERLGALVIAAPLIEIRPVRDNDRLKRIARNLSRTDWVVVTSANGAPALSEMVPVLRASAQPRIAAVGPATAAAVREIGLEPTYVPDRFAADEIARGLGDVEGTRVLVLQSDLASQALADDLGARGARVERWIAYETVAAEPPTGELEELRGGFDAILLASGSAARTLAAITADVPQAREALVVCIGPKTAAIAREVGLSVGLVAEEATSQGMIQALVSHFGESA